MQLPWGEKADFQGVIDLLTMKAYKGNGKTAVEIPAELKDEAEEARMVLVEAAAEGEDSLLENTLRMAILPAKRSCRVCAKPSQKATSSPPCSPQLVVT